MNTRIHDYTQGAAETATAEYLPSRSIIKLTGKIKKKGVEKLMLKKKFKIKNRRDVTWQQKFTR